VGGKVSLTFLVVSSSAAERCNACSSRETVCPSGSSGRFRSKAAADASDCGDSGSSPTTERSLQSDEVLLYSNAEANATVRKATAQCYVLVLYAGKGNYEC
jgi:hypothetical protein